MMQPPLAHAIGPTLGLEHPFALVSRQLMIFNLKPSIDMIHIMESQGCDRQQRKTRSKEVPRRLGGETPSDSPTSAPPPQSTPSLHHHNEDGVVHLCIMSLYVEVSWIISPYVLY
jgi:hypothetical protein